VDFDFGAAARFAPAGFPRPPAFDAVRLEAVAGAFDPPVFDVELDALSLERTTGADAGAVPACDDPSETSLSILVISIGTVQIIQPDVPLSSIERPNDSCTPFGMVFRYNLPRSPRWSHGRRSRCNIAR